MRTVLVLDDNEDFRQTISAILSEEDFDVIEAACPDDAYKILQTEKCDLIISDIHLPFTLGDDFHLYPYSCEVGVKTIHELRTVFPDLPVIAISAAGDIEKLREALKGFSVLSKPTSPSELLAVVERTLQASARLQ